MKNSHSDKVCPVELSGALDTSFRRLIQNPARILRPYLKPGDKVLDFGCGPGFFTIDIARLVGESGFVYAADLQEGMLDIVRRKIALHNFQDRVKVHKCEKSSISLDARVDFILAFYMIHELPGQENAFSEFKTILKPGGKILIIEPRFHVTKTDFHDMIINLRKSGFKIIKQPWSLINRTVLAGMDV